MELKFDVKKQIITFESTDLKVVEKSVDYLHCKFSFCDDWQGTIKTAVFVSAKGNIFNVVLEDDDCIVPWEVIEYPHFIVSVFCVIDNKRITTNKVIVKVLKSGYLEGETPKEPTPDVYTQILEKLDDIEAGGGVSEDKIKEIVNEELEEAKSSGEFDGKDGKDGANGKDGADGVSCTHSWNGTVLTVVSSSGTSSADLKGADGKNGVDGKDGKDGKDAIINDYELIKTIAITEDIPTVDEDGGVIPISFNLDNDGKPFKLEALRMWVGSEEAIVTEKYWRCDVNKSGNTMFYKKPSGRKYFHLHTERLKEKSWWTENSSKFYDNFTGSPLENGYMLGNVDYITSLIFKVANAPIGTTITVYGRRVSE